VLVAWGGKKRPLWGAALMGFASVKRVISIYFPDPDELTVQVSSIDHHA
jgi:hypothetical protein